MVMLWVTTNEWTKPKPNKILVIEINAGFIVFEAILVSVKKN